jgi:hypothetical protein
MDVLWPFSFPHQPGIAAPDPDEIAFGPQRIAPSGGLVIPRFRGEDGIFRSLQADILRNELMLWRALGAFAGQPNVIGGNAFTATGTLNSRSPASTNRFTRARRLGFVGSSTGGSFAGLHTTGANIQYTTGGAAGAGFFAGFIFGNSDAALVAGAHQFVGMTSNAGAPVPATNPNTFTNSIGVAQLNGGNNLNIVYGGSAAQAPQDLGANFPAKTLSTDLYELLLYARPDDETKVAWRVERMNTGDFAEGVLTAAAAGTQLPAKTTFIGPRAFRSNNATALAVGLDIVAFGVLSGL